MKKTPVDKGGPSRSPPTKSPSMKMKKTRAKVAEKTKKGKNIRRKEKEVAETIQKPNKGTKRKVKEIEEVDQTGEMCKARTEAPYLIYLHEKLKAFKKENPSIKIKDPVRNSIVDDWKAMTNDEQEPYKEMSKKAREENKELRAKGLLIEKEKKGTKEKKQRTNDSFTTRQSLPTIIEALKNFTDDQKMVVKSIGLSGLLELRCNQIDHKLCEWLVKNFDTSDCSLTLYGRKVNIFPNDVERMLGVSSRGVVPEICSAKELEELANQLGFNNNIISVTRLKDDLGKTSDAGDDFKMRFVLLAMGCLCLPGTKSGIRSGLLYLVKDVTQLDNINWSKLILDYLVDGITNYRKKNTSGLAGCVLFLMLFYLETFVMVGAPMPNPESNRYTYPRISFRGRMNFIMRHGLMKDTTKVELAPVRDREEAIHEIPTTEAASSRGEEARIIFLEKEVEELKVALPNETALKDEYERRMCELATKVVDIKCQMLEMSRSIKCDIQALRDDLKKALLEKMSGRKEVEDEDTNKKGGGEGERKGKEGENNDETGDKEEETRGDEDGKEREIGAESTGEKDEKEREKEVRKKDESTGEKRKEEEEEVEYSPIRGGSDPGPKSSGMSEIGSTPLVAPDENSPSEGTPLVFQKEVSVDVLSEDQTVHPIQKNAEPTFQRSPVLLDIEDENSCSPRMKTRRTVEWRPGKHCVSPYLNVDQNLLKKATKSNKNDKPPTITVKIREFTEQEKKIIRFVCDSQLPERAILVRANMEHADRRSLRCLSVGTWINDTIINCMAGKLTYNAKSKRPNERQWHWYMPTYVAHYILEGKGDVNSTVRQYFGSDKYTGDLKMVKKIFIPINHGNAHWFACVIDICKEEVLLLDPMVSPRNKVAREDMVRKTVNVMHKLLGDHYGKPYNMLINNFPIKRPAWVPQQKNSDDCGVYVMTFMEELDKLCPGIEFHFNSKEARGKILLELIQGNYNNLREEVLKEVEAYTG